MREKELRLALVCYGGISLAIYMHGITKEVWKLVRASAARNRGETPVGDTEIVYHALLEEMAPHIDLRVLVDIVAGASAGGINGIMLAHAIAGGHDMEGLRDLWLDGADVDKLLDADAAASGRFSKWWATPLVWYARSKGDATTDDIVDPSARGEVRAKLSRFMRSRWFSPPFSGVGFTRMLYEALDAMAAGPTSPPLIPAGLPLDLFVTVTDFHGRPEALTLHSPASIVETEHRLVIDFHSSGEGGGTRTIGDIAELAFAARATASFPGAFPPARVDEIDTVVADKAATWPGRKAFLTRVFPSRAAVGHPFENVALIDGSVLNNRPFGPAIEALRHRPAHREVDRRFVYIDPKPGMHGGDGDPAGGPPGFFTTILRALADIPREQPIRDNLEAISALSVRVRRLRVVVDGMAPRVDAAIDSAIGARFFFLPLTPSRLSDWRSRAQTAAARGAGFAHAAYGQLKLAQVVDTVAARIASLGGSGAAITAYVGAQVLIVEDATERDGAGSAYVGFLRRFDLDFRIRRFRFLLRRLNLLAVAQVALADRYAIEALKKSLYELLAPYLDRRRNDFYDAATRAAVAGDDAPRALAAFEAALDLKALDTATDARLVALFAMTLTSPVRKALLRAYLGFPFYDIVMLPLLQGDGLDEFDEIKVDRISPEDATAIRTGGYRATLKGTQFNSFGAFFSRAYRENDYLWGRLHGADRLVDIVASTIATALDPAVVGRIKQRAFRAILDAERPHLTHVADLFDAIENEIGAIA